MEYISKPLDEQEFQSLLVKTCAKIAERKEYEKVKVQMGKMDDSRIMLFQEYLRGEQSVQKSHVSRAVQFIEKRYADDIGVQGIANELLMSESYLSRLFKDVTGYTIGDYLLNYRIKQACLLLNDSSAKIYEVANQVGIRDQRYFSVLFKKIVGLTPREFQNKLN